LESSRELYQLVPVNAMTPAMAPTTARTIPTTPGPAFGAGGAL